MNKNTPRNQLENIAFVWHDSFDYISKWQFGIRAVLNHDAVWLLRDIEQDERQAKRDANWALKMRVI